MASDGPQYHVGQIVNGHRWTGSTWEPVSAEEAAATAPSVASEGSTEAATGTYAVGQVVNGHRWTGSTWEPVQPGPAPMGSYPSPTPNKASTPWWKRWWVWAAAAAFVFIGGIALATGGGSSQNAAGSKSSSPAAATSDDAKPAQASKAAEKPKPKEETALDKGRAEFADAYGTFKPISKSGNSDSVITLPAGATAGIATMSYKGSGNFSVQVLDAQNQSTIDLLANTIGSWKGSAIYGANALGGDAAKLKVTGSGSWTIQVKPVSTAPEITFPASKSGAGVYLYVGDVADWAITHQGSENFAVVTYKPSGLPDLLVNEIGNYKGTVPASGGPLIVSVNADGKWTIKGS